MSTEFYVLIAILILCIFGFILCVVILYHLHKKEHIENGHRQPTPRDWWKDWHE